MPKKNYIQVNHKNDQSNENVVEIPDIEVEVDHEIGIIETKIVTDAMAEIRVSDNALFTLFKIIVKYLFKIDMTVSLES